MGGKCSNAVCMCCITTLTTQPYLYSDTTHTAPEHFPPTVNLAPIILSVFHILTDNGITYLKFNILYMYIGLVVFVINPS
jgi:hypothetical protein